MSVQPSSNVGANEQAEIDAALAVLRGGMAAEKIAARERLARMFERRDLLEYAAECLTANGRIVAMPGGGGDDALAPRAADIGVVMGITSEMWTARRRS